MDTRGYAYFKLGQFQQAIQDYEAALRAYPGMASTLYQRGVAKLKLGDGTGEVDIAAARSINSRIAERMSEIGVIP